MIEGLAQALEGSGQPGLTELRELLQELFGGADATGRLIDQQRLKARIYRLRIAAGDRVHPLVVKRLDPGHAQRNRLAAARWLPAIGLDGCAPRLLGSAAERTGDSVWHVYEDLGDWRLDPKHPDPERVGAAIELIAQLHMRSAEHPLLPECRRCGGDLGMYFYASNVRDAICGLEALRPSAIELSPEQITLRDRLLERLYRLRGEQPRRARLMAELGGPDVLLHGDLWTTNTFVRPTGEGLQARLIDWDHVGVGPVSYDLSTFLYRFAAHDRPWILERYREGVARAGWRLPFAADLNVLFDTAECARYASRAVWPTVALLQDRAGWGFAELAEIEQWFAALKPALVP